MTKSPFRILAAGVFLFLILACNIATPVPAETPGEGLPADTPVNTVASTPMPSATETTAVTPTETGVTVAPRLYAVILVPEGGMLPAYSAPGSGSASAGALGWNAAGFISTGRVEVLGSETWLEIRTPDGGPVWVDRKFLTEYVPSADFCADGRAVSLFDTLYEAARTNDGRILTPIVSPVHGLTVTYIHNGNPKVYDPAQAGMVFGSLEVVDWGLGPGSGLPVQGTFEDLVRPDLLAVFASAETHCNTIQLGGASYSVSWPSIWKNINFYSVYKPGTPGMEMDWMTWVTGVEYVDGAPYLFSLSRYNWEP